MATDKLGVKTVHENRFSELYETTLEDLKKIGTYRAEFSPLIARYVEMRLQFELLMGQWYGTGCRVTEAYTNKAGAVNQRKTALYQSIETLRRELLDVENVLGLTPAGIRKINQAALTERKKSAMEKLLAGDGD